MSLSERFSKWSFSYWFAKTFIIKPLYNAYYGKIEFVNKKNILKNTAIIYAPNHQNALMDPMMFATNLPGQSTFLARADVFKKSFAIKVLTWAKILPVFRIRDGVSSLKKNEEVFDTCASLLKLEKYPLLLFPEGNHGEKRRLRPLVKGLFRIAFQAQEKFGNKGGVKILPVGLDYNHYQKFRQKLLVVFGDYIDVSDFWDSYTKNPVEATNDLRDRLAEEMKKLMIHIETEEYYDLYMGMRTIYNKQMRKELGLKGKQHYTRFKADKEMIFRMDNALSKNPESILELDEKYKKYINLRDKLNFRDWVFTKKRYSVITNAFNLILCFILSPMILVGFLNNWPHYIIPPILARKIKDPQFVSTMKWATGAFILIIYYLILFTLALLFIPVWWIKIVYIIMLPLSGILALQIRKIAIKSWARIRYSFNPKHKNEITKARDVYNEIENIMSSIIHTESKTN